MIKYLPILFFLSSIFLWAQERNLAGLNDKKKYELANRLMEENSYYNAIEILKELTTKDTIQKKYIFKLAECYYKTRNYSSALLWYPKLNENLVAKGKKSKDKEAVISIATFHQAECLKNTGKYEEARELFQIFANSNYRDPKGLNVKTLAKNEIKSCEFAMRRKTSDTDVEIIHLGNNINTAYSEFAPTLRDDNTLIFSSYQSDSVIKIKYGERHSEHVRIFESDFENSVWGDPKEIEKLTPHFGHASGGSYSPDKKRFYFSRCRSKNNNKINCKIYVQKVDSNGQFEGKPKKLNSPINHNIHSSSQPVVGTRKKGKNIEEVLFFVSDMRGTYGGTDIWFAPIDKKGNVGSPSNCGRSINTIRDEISPYFDIDASTLYFSSNYHPGYGGFDVFKSKGWATKWQKAENLKLPINSSYDDMFYTLLPENKLKGFLVSNRIGSIPLTHPTCCEDIFEMQYQIPAILSVTARDSATNEIIPEAITVEGGKYESLSDSLFNADGAIDFDTISVSDDLHFLSVIKAKEKSPNYYIIGSTKKVTITGNKKGYKPHKVSFITDSLTNSGNFISETGLFTNEVNEKSVKVTLFMAKGEAPVKKTKEVEKSDTIKVKSTLKEQFAIAETEQNINEPKVDIFVGDTSKKKVEEIDFNINLSEYKAVGFAKENATTLDSLIQVLKKHPKYLLGITTHTDGIGSEEYNMQLSEKRAIFIANYLIENGLSKKRIKEAKGVGESQPLVKETFPDGSDNPLARKVNRRTEIRLFLVK
ncbi:MAG: OmpA family protein [Bacteroidota bacterium]|nr:OmpA family protein [Bacteroidota bacterium]